MQNINPLRSCLVVTRTYTLNWAVSTYTKSNIVQYNEYYPFGLQTANSWTRENVTGNNFLYNGGSELNTTTAVYDLFFRNYDPALGRMTQVDPVAAKYASLTPYNYSFNNPVSLNDPTGADSYTINHSAFYNQYYIGYTYDDRIEEVVGTRQYVFNDLGRLNSFLYSKGGAGISGTGHWAVGLRSMETNLGLLSSRQFESIYGVNLNTNEGRWEIAQALGRAPTESELAYVGRKLGLGTGEMFNGEAYFITVLQPAIYDSHGNRLADQINGVITVGVGRKDLISALKSASSPAAWMVGRQTQGGSQSVSSNGFDWNPWFTAAGGVVSAFDGGNSIAIRELENGGKFVRLGEKAAYTGANTFGKVLGAVGVGITIGQITYEVKHNQANTHTLVNGLVTGGTFIVGTAAVIFGAPVVATGAAIVGIGYGVFSLFGGDDLINDATNNWGRSLIYPDR